MEFSGCPNAPEQNGPFIHRFATSEHKYIFDVNTCRILRVPPPVSDIVDDFGRLGKADMVAKYSDRYSSAAIVEAHDAALTARQAGFLLPTRPSRIVVPWDQDLLREKLAEERTSVSLVVSERCNFRCAYCIYGGVYAHRRTHSPAMMSWDIAKRALDDFLDHSGKAVARGVHFYGGEPLLNLPLIHRSMEYIHEHRRQTDVAFGMTTNGSLLEGEAADLLAKYETRITVSLDGPEHVHDRYRRLADGSGTWQRVMHNLRIFLHKFPDYKSNHRLRFHAVIAPPADFCVIEDFFANCDLFTPEMGLSVAGVSPQDTTCSNCAPFDGSRIEGGESVYRRFIDSIRSGALNARSRHPEFWLQTALLGERLLTFYKRGYASSQQPCLPDIFYPLQMCVPGVRRLHVNTDGTYYACERVEESPAFQVGSVEEGVSPERVYGLLQAFVDLTKEECPSCWCLPICTAGCVTAITRDGKMDPAVRKQACESCRQKTHQLMTDVCEALEANPDGLRYMDHITMS